MRSGNLDKKIFFQNFTIELQTAELGLGLIWYYRYMGNNTPYRVIYCKRVQIVFFHTEAQSRKPAVTSNFLLPTDKGKTANLFPFSVYSPESLFCVIHDSDKGCFHLLAECGTCVDLGA